SIGRLNIYKKIFKLSWFMIGEIGRKEIQEKPLDWWQTAVFYQIYPRSFKDSDGDGIGDLNGITEKLDYLKDLGIGAVWLSPIYRSPMADFGYDISDFMEIDPLFGNFIDFDNLQRKAKDLGIKIILDFVPNHSSNQHEWFLKSARREEPYTDFYIWADGKIDPVSGERLEPTNWLSVFRGSAWTWNEQRQQYYLHHFAVEQPDLNFRNPVVVNEMKNVIQFWLDKGVDGFRMDAIPYLFESPYLADEESSGNPNAKPGDYSNLIHSLTQNLLETYDMITQWRALLDAKTAEDNITRLMMIEAYADLEEAIGYYGTETKPGGHFPFNFLFINDLNNESTAFDFRDTVNQWMSHMSEGRWANWVIGNHDQHRVASRYGSELIDSLNMLALLLPGSAITYNGEEIGMEDGFVSWNDTKDPAGINAGEERYLILSRDPARTPFQWDNSTSAGFSENSTTWLPVSSNYKTLNLEHEMAAEKSHYKVYKKLIQARQTPTIQRGNLNTYTFSDNVFAFSRTLEKNEIFVVIVNLGFQNEQVNLHQAFQNLPDNLYVYTASVHSTCNSGDKLPTADITLKCKEGLVLRSTLSS
ncbi:hypothetical protein L9F63_006584, partial [Diploptera punctata]